MRALLLAAAYGSLFSHDVPPVRFQGDATVTVRFASQDAVTHECGRGMVKPPHGQFYEACTKGDGTILMPNPCASVEQDYALTLCHELGHHHGWEPRHEL